MTTRVLLYSGGLDSFIAYWLWQKELAKRGQTTNVQCVYYDLGTAYSAKERCLLPGHVQVSDALKLGSIERSDSFVPGRNSLLVTLAQAEYDADEVALCAVRGEFSRDKHPQFYKRISSLLSYTTGKPVRVFTPFAKRTKTQAVRRYIAEGFSVPELLKTVSCYAANERACGHCMPCFRRWVAFENNGIAHLQQWNVEPWSSTKFRSVGEFKANMPISTWYDFGIANADVGTAYARLALRLRKGRNAS